MSVGGSLKEYALKRISWYGMSAFRLRAGTGETIMVDPFRVPASAGPAGLILITHPHFDHFDRRAVAGLRTPGATVTVPQAVAEGDLEGMSPGQKLIIGEISVSAVPAYTPGRPYHPRARGWLGYVIAMDGLRIYHAGDTDLIPEMKGLAPDIALLPVGGLFGMNVKAALEAVEILQASLCIPMHYGRFIFPRDAGDRFAAAAGKKGMVLPLS